MEANPVSSLRNVDLVDRGDIIQVTGRAFVAGTLPVKVRQTASSSVVLNGSVLGYNEMRWDVIKLWTVRLRFGFG